MPPEVTAVVLAYGDEPWVERCIEALLASRGVIVDVVVVDNGCTTGAPGRLEGHQGVRVLTPGHNMGFAGGCNLGARHATGQYLAFVNADAVVADDALVRLVEALQPGVGICSGSIRLAAAPDLMNSAGNPVHFSGLSWSGGFGQPASRHAEARDVASASGAALLIRTDLWQELEGFAPEYFAYLEDAELSMRVWQRGLRVVYQPEAIVLHRYEFSRNDTKNYLLERNRLVWLLTVLERRTLLALAPALVLVEASICVLAWTQGWLPAKTAGWRWVLRHGRWVVRRRRRLQQERVVGDADLLDLLSARLTMTNVSPPPGLALLNMILSMWWWLARHSVLRGPASPVAPGRPTPAPCWTDGGPVT